ncbi:auxin efflux carrier [Punctularia strigosozonata HHB-11173 SS5]|uniref:auxin efflux carrier n=1 Tax=Punctularia strigosozonata (strain HHB-11173) TaxID=741275 RepID=UPI00044186A7|nr:auxin efflux carrier [Punctularia strigosozonata HHB-11173 SS5]EIN11116.1 auxin efflux carrier [Punctularia strigosozonata HHB-11173 SS5]
MATAGFLIYSGIMPLLKMFLTIFFGYVLAKRDLFPPAATRGASQVTMNVSLPALIFANIVPAFTPQNVSAIGPLMLIAFIYVLIGFTFGLLIREVCYVPRNFWQGIVVLCGLSNWGNLPNAVVTTVTQQKPFNGDSDSALGVSYVAIFIVCYHICFWVFGAAASLAWDYRPAVPQGRYAEVRIAWDQKPIGGWIARYLLRRRPLPLPFRPVSPTRREEKEKGPAPEDRDVEQAELGDVVEVEPEPCNSAIADDNDPDIKLARQVSHLSTPSFRSRRASAAWPSSSRPHVHTQAPQQQSLPAETVCPEDLPGDDRSSASSSTCSSAFGPILKAIAPLRVVITPITLTIAISLPIALITPLKALFVDVSAISDKYSSGSWRGPDGKPVLNFVIDTASFLGSITIPMALVLLGASFARLRLSRPVSRLPIVAMFAVAGAKLFVLPVIGVFIVQAMVRRGLIAEDAKVERFVATFLSGTPAAVNQLIVSQLYSPDGNVDTLSAFLLVQYALMFFSSSALTAVSLLLL